MKNRFLHILLAIIGTIIFGACGVARHIPEGSHVLYDNEVQVVMADSSSVDASIKDAMKSSSRYITQHPNSRFLGIKPLRLGLGLYVISSPKDKSFIGRFFRRIGQAPVVYDENRAKSSVRQLQGLMEMKGCFGSEVTFDTIKTKKHSISIGYNVVATHRYKVDEVVYFTSKPEIKKLIEEAKTASPLQAGQYYDQENIASDRKFVLNTLLEAGYYTANQNLITYLVDTTYSDKKLSIEVHISDSSLSIHHINNIYIYPNSNNSISSNPASYDTFIYTYPLRTRTIDYHFVYDEPMSLHPSTISRAMLLFPGMTFRPRFIRSTYNSLLNLRNFRYINIDFSPSQSSTDTLPLIDAHVKLKPSTQQRLSFSLEVTNASPLTSLDSGNFFSNGNLGIETALEYQHKNLFGGAEQFKLKGSLLVELPKIATKSNDNKFYNIFDAFETGLEASLDMPIFMLPFTSNIMWQRTRPHTLVSLNGSYQYHYYFERLLLGTSFGYSWSTNRQHNHQLLPIEFTFVRMIDIDDAFAQRLKNINDLRLTYQYSSHFIMDARYDYTYTNQIITSKTNFSAFHITLESAGNLLSGVNLIAPFSADSNGIKEIFGVPYAQYIRLSADASRHIYHGENNTFVARVLLGLGMPYGNSVAMPYEKSFFGGGPSTMRAWQLRRLGPGTYSGGGVDIERVGDMQLVINLEERFPIAGVFEGAAFVDAGNVWLYRPSDEYKGGEIALDNFIKATAVGVGLGLRLNVSIATIRFDVAIPLYDPGYDVAERFRLPHWKIRQMVANFGIGYPF